MTAPSEIISLLASCLSFSRKLSGKSVLIWLRFSFAVPTIVALLERRLRLLRIIIDPIISPIIHISQAFKLPILELFDKLD